MAYISGIGENPEDTLPKFSRISFLAYKDPQLEKPRSPRIKIADLVKFTIKAFLSKG